MYPKSGLWWAQGSRAMKGKGRLEIQKRHEYLRGLRPPQEPPREDERRLAAGRGGGHGLVTGNAHAESRLRAGGDVLHNLPPGDAVLTRSQWKKLPAE